MEVIPSSVARQIDSMFEENENRKPLGPHRRSGQNRKVWRMTGVTVSANY